MAKKNTNNESRLNIDKNPSNKVKKILVSVENDKTDPIFNRKSKAASGGFADFYRGTISKRADLSKIDRRDPNRRKKIIGWTIFILIILLAATLSGFYFYVNQEDKFSGQNIEIEVITPLSVASGDEITITLVINNNENVDLVNSDLILQYPSNFTFIEASIESANEANNAWNIGKIKSGASKEIKITGILLGELHSKNGFNAILSYIPANFLSDFQMSQDFKIEISDSILELDLVVPSTMVSDFEYEFELKYSNNSKKSIKQVRVVLKLSDDFKISNFEPKPGGGDMIWNFDSLGNGEKGSIKWQGSLTADEGAMREIKASIGFVNDNGSYQIQSEESTILFIVNPQLLLDMSINEGNTDNTASLGSTLKYVIKYNNESQSEIKNMTMSVKLDGDYFDWDSLADINEGTISDNVITWNKENIPDLESILPEGQGQFEFSIDLKDAVTPENSKDINYFVTSQAFIKSDDVVELDGGTLEIVSDILTTRINSKITLRAEGRFYNDEYLPVGSGPLPPQAGAQTTYQVYWNLLNGANEVSDVSVTTELPEGVTWENDTSITAGIIKYDSASRVVTWSINKMPEHIGQFNAELEVRFAVSITPTSKHVGQIMILANKSTITATDVFTEDKISIEQDIITTSLNNDPLVVGQGVVVNSNTNSNINSTN